VAVEADPDLAPHLTVTGPDDQTEMLVFNAAYGSTSNSDVRHALSAATDRSGLSALIKGDSSFAAKTLTPAADPSSRYWCRPGCRSGHRTSSGLRLRRHLGSSFGDLPQGPVDIGRAIDAPSRPDLDRTRSWPSLEMKDPVTPAP
jgi:hypothetical protein